MRNFTTTLAAARRTGAVQQPDAELMAVLCVEVLPHVVGAVSPRLVWEGAQARGLTTEALAGMAARDPRAVEELQWIGAES